MSDYIGTIGSDIATYAVIISKAELARVATTKQRADARILPFSGVERTKENTPNFYQMTDCQDNVLILETDEIIEKTDGKHFFLVEGKVKEHRTVDGIMQTVLTDCDCELVDHRENIRGDFFGCIGEEVEFPGIEVNFRRTDGTEWKVTGEFSKVAPQSEYRIVFTRGRHVFLIPYDTKRKLKPGTTGKYNIKARVTGYALENGCKATFLRPVIIECKNGPFIAGGGIARWGRR